MIRSVALAVLTISMIVGAVLPIQSARATGRPGLSTYDLTGKVPISSVYRIAADNSRIYLIGESPNVTIIDKALLQANNSTSNSSAIRLVTAFQSDSVSCGRFTGTSAIVVDSANDLVWVAGNYVNGDGLARINLNGFTVQAFLRCGGSRVLTGLATDAHTVYGAFQLAGEVSRFNQNNNTWTPLVSSIAVGLNSVVVNGTSLWFNMYPSGLGTVNTDGTGQTLYPSIFQTYLERTIILGVGNRIWYAGGNMVGYFNTLDHSVREWDYPETASGPIGLAFDSYGKLWVAGGWDHMVRELDPVTGEWNTAADVTFPGTGTTWGVANSNGEIWGIIDNPLTLFKISTELIASFTFTPVPPIVGEVASFDATPSLSTYNPIISYQWFFSDGSHISQTFGQRVSHTFTSVGVYGVNLTITDSTGVKSADFETIYVSSHPYTTSVQPGMFATYDLSLTNNPSITIQASITNVVGSNITYNISPLDAQHNPINSTIAWIDVATGDQSILLPPFFIIASNLNYGEPIYTLGSLAYFSIVLTNNTRILDTWRTTNHLRVDAGVASIVAKFDRATGLMIYSSFGLVSGSSVLYVVYTLESTNMWTMLSPDFSVSNTGALRETFTSKTTGGEAPYTFHWDFGDGQFSTQTNPSHTFAHPGTYTVTLTITDSAGNTATTHQTVTVQTAQTPTPNTSSKTTQSSIQLPRGIVYYLATGLGIGVVLTILAAFFEEGRKRRYASRF